MLVVIGSSVFGTAAAQGSERATAPTMTASSIYLLPANGARDAVRSASVMPSPPPAGDTARASTTTRLLIGAGSSLSRASLVQMPSENVLPGGYVRPRYALGFRSTTMKNFVQGMGLEADQCLAPLVRARLTFSQDGRDAGGRVMVFARCTLR